MQNGGGGGEVKGDDLFTVVFFVFEVQVVGEAKACVL